MKRYWTTSIAAMVAILALSACSFFKHKPPSAADFVDLNLFIGGKPLDEFLADKPKAKEFVIDLVGRERFGGEKGLGELRALLEAIDRGDATDTDVAALRGMAGFSTVQLARSVLFGEIRKEKGLIGDFLFDKNRMSGHLTVDTRIEIFKTATSYKKDEPDRTLHFQWHVEVMNGGFVVLPRQGDPNDPNDPNYPDNPFPGTVDFPDFSTDPSDSRSIWYRGLNRKLWAKGKKIVVRDIYLQVDDGRIRRVPDGHLFYRPSDESCIDLMVKAEPPDYKIPAFRIDFPEQSGYCLGRCDQPYIYNSM